VIKLPKYSLRSLLIAITLFALWMSFQAYKVGKVRRAKEFISQRGGMIINEHEWDGKKYDPNAAHQVPKVIREALGDEWVVTPIYITLHSRKIKDEDLLTLLQFESLEALDLGNTGISDEALRHVVQLPNLRTLKISFNPKITDDGLAIISELSSLEYLTILKTSISETGLLSLKSLPSLRVLIISGGEFSQQTVDQLSEQLPNCNILRR
jgi:Leucine-rich repeat (LRR) protein